MPSKCISCKHYTKPVSLSEQCETIKFCGKLCIQLPSDSFFCAYHEMRDKVSLQLQNPHSMAIHVSLCHEAETTGITCDPKNTYEADAFVKSFVVPAKMTMVLDVPPNVNFRIRHHVEADASCNWYQIDSNTGETGTKVCLQLVREFVI